MKHLLLKKYGKFLTGRALAHDVSNEEEIPDLCKEVFIDFGGVEVASQSFLEELFKIFRMKGIKYNDIKCMNISNDILKTRVDAIMHTMKIYTTTNGKASHKD